MPTMAIGSELATAAEPPSLEASGSLDAPVPFFNKVSVVMLFGLKQF